jgi:hypothetical protein
MIINLDTYQENSFRFFEIYNIDAFDSANLLSFNQRLHTLKTLYTDSSDPLYAVAASNLILGYNALYYAETYLVGDNKVGLELYENYWINRTLIASQKDLEKLKNYFIYSNNTLDFQTFVQKYGIPINKTQYRSVKKANCWIGDCSKQEAYLVPDNDKLAAIEAAFEVTPYFYRDFRKFLSFTQQDILAKDEKIPDGDKELMKSLDSVKDLLTVNNKYVLYSIFGAAALALLFKTSRR